MDKTHHKLLIRGVPIELHRRFKAAASLEGTTMSKVLLGAIEQYVVEQPGAGQGVGFEEASALE